MTIGNHQNIPSSTLNTVKPPYITMAIFAIIGFVLLLAGFISLVWAARGTTW